MLWVSDSRSAPGTKSDRIVIRVAPPRKHVAEGLLDVGPTSRDAGVHSVNPRSREETFDGLAPDPGVHALFDFRQLVPVGDEPLEFPGFVRIKPARELLSFTFEAVGVAFDKVEVSRHYVERVLSHETGESGPEPVPDFSSLDGA